MGSNVTYSQTWSQMWSVNKHNWLSLNQPVSLSVYITYSLGALLSLKQYYWWYKFKSVYSNKMVVICKDTKFWQISLIVTWETVCVIKWMLLLIAALQTNKHVLGCITTGTILSSFPKHRKATKQYNINNDWITHLQTSQ